MKLTGQTLEPTPTVGIKQKKNGKFVGKLLDAGKEVKLAMGTAIVYSFQLVDTDMPVQIKGTDGEYHETDVKEGDQVSVFAPTVLNRALQLAKVGQTLTIVYLGKEKSKRGAAYHNFDVDNGE